MSNDVQELISAAQGGRVAHTGFLAPDEAAALTARLRQADVSVHVSGGYPGARRRVVTAFPDNVPEATTPLIALYAENVHEPDDLRAAFRTFTDAENVGDIINHQAGLSVIVLGSGVTPPTSLDVRGQTVTLEEVPLDKVTSGSRKKQVVVVPSLRVDALGAKAFNVSRSYFSKGIKAGNVTVNGVKASKSSSAEPGDEVYAEGIGRFYVSTVQGETRRGNLKVAVDIEKA